LTQERSVQRRHATAISRFGQQVAQAQTSMFAARKALSSMNCLRGSTSSPISIVKT
jgi:hypothetical protein